MYPNITTTLSRLTTIYKTLAEKYLNDIGLHAGQAQILSVLWRRDSITQAEIGRELSISAPTVNSLVAKLDKSKLVKIKLCKQDKRQKIISLTSKGRNKRDETEKQWQEIDKIILRDFSDTEKVLILMLLEKIKNNLQSVDFDN